MRTGLINPSIIRESGFKCAGIIVNESLCIIYVYGIVKPSSATERSFFSDFVYRYTNTAQGLRERFFFLADAAYFLP